MAGHARDDRVEPVAQRIGRVPLGEAVGQVLHQSVDVGLAQQRRDFAHGDRARAEALEIEPEALERRRRVLEPAAILLGHFDNDRYELHLARHGTARELRLELLIDQPLMRRMLVDQHE